MTGPSALILSVAMLAAIALVIGGVAQLRRSEKRGWLMLIAAAVLVGNVLIWAV
ncbi:hypothetical protein ACFSCW_08305 [Sphingomonas tabacisoli]|uniref:Uncharacterized protein n=1 Tax=Sphingomonas tabacisoli TaxID=2249466 RepID=A0ABW4I2F0_9SPHN